jgi:DNA-binding response OmpR family regulator
MPTVLVVENDVPAVRLMAWGLMEVGFEVAAAHMPEAERHLANKRPDFIIFNTLKPTDEKAQLVARLRELAPQAKIIDVSNATSRDPGVAFADLHLTTPVTVADLVKSLDALSA